MICLCMKQYIFNLDNGYRQLSKHNTKHTINIMEIKTHDESNISLISIEKKDDNFHVSEALKSDFRTNEYQDL